MTRNDGVSPAWFTSVFLGWRNERTCTSWLEILWHSESRNLVHFIINSSSDNIAELGWGWIFFTRKLSGNQLPLWIVFSFSFIIPFAEGFLRETREPIWVALAWCIRILCIAFHYFLLFSHFVYLLFFIVKSTRMICPLRPPWRYYMLHFLSC